MNGRMVWMTEEQDAEINLCIEELMRARLNERAATLMNLALAYKFTPEPPQERPSNVYPIVKHEGDNWSKRVGA